jgi:DNA-binding CsgD family transcriptional regulator/tetratricopeptide (TPR) repeat protein
VQKVFCPVTVGREDELALLEQALEAAREGRGSAVVLSGEPGIGKSRLAGDVEAHVQRAGLNVLRGRGVEGGQPLPFRPLAEALQSTLRTQALPGGAELAPYRSALGSVVPEWADASAPAEPPTAVLEGMLRLLRVLAGDGGLLLVLDDLHWADAETLRVVEYLADNLGSERILCLCTERSGWPGPAAAVLARLVTRRAALRIELERLADDQVETMARLSLGVDAVGASIVGALRTRAEGVPFLVEEMLGAYLAAGGPAEAAPEWWISRRVADALPPSYRDVLRARLGALDHDARRVVTAVAVLGRTFDWPLLGPVTSLATDEVLRTLRAAASEQLLVVAGGAHPTAFAFRHALVREAILAELLPAEHSELAGIAAETLEDTYPGLPGEWCERAADLRERAGDHLGACRLLQESARRALTRAALATAEETLLRARALAGDDYMVWMGIDELLIEVLARAGKTRGLVELGRRLLAGMDVYLRYGPNVVSRSRLTQLHLHVARAGLLAGDVELAAEYFGRARALAKDADAIAHARVDALGAQVALARGDAAGARAQARSALAAGGELGLPDLICEALAALGRTSLEEDATVEAVASFERLEREATAAGLVVWRIQALLELGTIDLQSREEAARLLEARELAVRAGAVSALAAIDLQLAWHALGLARLGAARERLESCVEACRRSELSLLPRALVAAATLLALEGRRQESEASVAEAIAADPRVEAEADGTARAVSLLQADDRDAALEALGSDGGPWLSDVRGVLAALADGAAAPGSGYGRAVAPGRNGDVEAAVAAFAHADELAPPGWRRHLARRLAAEAAREDRWGDPVRWVREALAFFESATLAGFAESAKALLRRWGEPVPRRGRGTADVPAGLRSRGVTSREMDVLLLAAEGLSNRDIAERLFLSRRTVETHVASLLRKTGAASRAGLAAEIP